uniref:Uncharacterized protein n=1 Tax=Coturnix japonica TaxID=93934 RepID=A0A8C2UA37_COTJA
KGTLQKGHCTLMSDRECLLPDKKCHPVSRLAKMSSSDTETRHPHTVTSFLFTSLQDLDSTTPCYAIMCSIKWLHTTEDGRYQS